MSVGEVFVSRLSAACTDMSGIHLIAENYIFKFKKMINFTLKLT